MNLTRKTFVHFTLFGATMLALGTALPISVQAQNAAKEHGPIAWKESLDEAKKIALKEKKPVMLDFGATWCGPCKMMLASTYKDKTVVDKSKKFVPVLIDVDKQPKVAGQFNVSGIPTIVFIGSNGKVINQIMGYQDTKQFLKLMDEALKKNKG